MFKINQALRDHAKSAWGFVGKTDAELARFLTGEVSKKKIKPSEIRAISGSAKSAPTPSGTAGNDGKGNPKAPEIPKHAGQGTQLMHEAGDSGHGSQKGNIDVVSAAKQFDATKSAVYFPKHIGQSDTLHPKAGRPVQLMVDDSIKAIHAPSQLEKAIGGAYWKILVRDACKASGIQPPAYCRMTELDKALLTHAIENEEWIGVRTQSPVSGDDFSVSKAFDGGKEIKRRRLTQDEQTLFKQKYIQRAISDDVDSGGLYMAPVAFDDAVITYPLLFGQVFPYVQVRDTNRRRVQRPIMKPVNFSASPSGTTQATPFDTSSLISNFETTIHRATAAIEFDLDLEADSPIAIFDTVIDYLGKSAMQWLDFVATYGNGVNEPLGMFKTAGLLILPSVFGTGGPLTYQDANELANRIPTNYKLPQDTWAYVGNDTTRAKLKQIRTTSGVETVIISNDESRSEYKVLGKDYRVVNSYNSIDMPNGVFGYFALSRYNMYRRLERQVIITDQGRQLALANKRLLVYRMRWGGQLELGGYGAAITDGDRT